MKIEAGTNEVGKTVCLQHGHDIVVYGMDTKSLLSVLKVEETEVPNGSGIVMCRKCGATLSEIRGEDGR